MALEADFYATITADAGVSAIVGSRVYPLRAPQNVTKPYITFQRILTNPVSSIDGNLNTVRARLQIDCWADTYAAVRGLYTAVKAYLNSSPAGLAATLLLEARDFYEDDTRLYRVSIDAAITYHEV